MCGQPLVYDDGDPNCYNNDEIYLSEDGTPEGDVDMNREITCQNCGCHVMPGTMQDVRMRSSSLVLYQSRALDIASCAVAPWCGAMTS